MMRHHGILADLLLQRQRDTLGPAAAQRKNERRAMLIDERRKCIVHRLPMLMGRERAKLRTGRNDLEIEIARNVISTDYPNRSRHTDVFGSYISAGEKGCERL